MREEYDLSDAKTVKDFPELMKLQAELKGKSRITIMLDNIVIQGFKYLAEEEGVGYQTLINRVLRDGFTRKHVDEETLRRVLREEIEKYSITR